MTSHSEDEAFDNFIEEMDSDGCDVYQCDKENFEGTKENNKAKTKTEQIDKIIAFVKKYNEQMIEKANYSLLWQSLAEELNSIGPPRNSAEKWKRIWTVYKYNNRKRLSNIFGHESASQEGGLSHSMAQHSSHSDSILVDNANTIFQSEALGQLSGGHPVPISVDIAKASKVFQSEALGQVSGGHPNPIIVGNANENSQSEVSSQLFGGDLIPVLVDNSNAREHFQSEVLNQFSLVTDLQKIIIEKLEEQNVLLTNISKQN